MKRTYTDILILNFEESKYTTTVGENNHMIKKFLKNLKKKS